MSDSVDNPAFSNVENIGTFSVENAFFLVFESTPEGATKASAKCIPAASLAAAFTPAHPEMSVTFADNVPAFNVENQTLRLPNAPRLHLTTPVNGRTYTFTSGDGQQTQAVFIPNQEDLTHEPASEQTFRWRFTKQSNVAGGEATSVVIHIPTIADDIFNPDYTPSNQPFARYDSGMGLNARNFYARSNNTEDFVASNFTASGTVHAHYETGVSDVKELNEAPPENFAVGSFIIYSPNSTAAIHEKRKALTDNEDGIVIILMTSEQRDALAVNNYNRLILNTTTGKLNFHNGTAWRELQDSPI